MTSEEEDFDGNFEEFEDELQEDHPTVEQFQYSDPLSPKQKKKKMQDIDLKVYDAKDDTDDELSELKHDISEAKPSARGNGSESFNSSEGKYKNNKLNLNEEQQSPAMKSTVEQDEGELFDEEEPEKYHAEGSSLNTTALESDNIVSSHSMKSDKLSHRIKKKKGLNTSTSETTDLETQVQKLKDQNQELKMQLLELNNALDEQLSKKGVRIEKKRTVLVTSDKEMKNLMKQLDIYKKANEDLKKQLYTTDSDRYILMENKLQESKILIDQLMEEKKSLQIIQRNQSKALEDYSNGNDKTVDTLKSESNFLKAKISKLKEQLEQQNEILEQKGKLLEMMENRVRELEDIMKEANVTKEGLQRIAKMERELEERAKVIEEEKRKREIEGKARQSVEKKFKIYVHQTKLETKKLQEEVDELKAKLEEKDREVREKVLQLKNNSSVASIKDPSPQSNMKPQAEPTQLKSAPNSATNGISKVPKPNFKPSEIGKPSKQAQNQQQRQPKVPTRTKIPGIKKRSGSESATSSSNEHTPRMKKTEQEKQNGFPTMVDVQDNDVMEDMDDDFIVDEEDENKGEDTIEEHISDNTAAALDDPILLKSESSGGNIFKPMF